MAFRKTFTFLCLAAGVIASTSGAAYAEIIHVSISRGCFGSFYGPHAARGGNANRPRLDFQPWDSATARAFIFDDARTAIALYVESDGRHIAAINAQGALLWVSNPFEEGKLCPYRTPRPVISSLATYNILRAYWDSFKTMGMNPSHTFAKIEFDSSQFGLLDEANGYFYPGGQN